MTRDPEKLCAAREAEIAHDKERGVDVESIKARMIDDFELRRQSVNDWVRDAELVTLAFEIWESAFDLDLSAIEARSRIKQSMLKQFGYYAEKAALREAGQIAEESPY